MDVFHDNFNRSDDSSLGTSSEGWSWNTIQPENTSWQIKDNKAYVERASSGYPCIAQANIDITSLDQYASFVTGGTSNYPGCFVRGNNEGTSFYAIVRNNGLTLKVYRVDGSFRRDLQNIFTAMPREGIPSGTQITLAVEGNGERVTLYTICSGILVGKYYDDDQNRITTGLRTGLCSIETGQSGIFWDNFEAGPISELSYSFVAPTLSVRDIYNVEIVSGIYSYGTSHEIIGVASDYVDELISDNIIWTSNIQNGILASGNVLNSSGLISGIHTVNASITNSNNLTTTKEFEVNIVSLTSPARTKFKNSIDRKITLPNVNLPLYSIMDHNDNNPQDGISYTRNPSCWIYGIDLSCVCVLGAGSAYTTLISPRHVIMAKHVVQAMLDLVPPVDIRNCTIRYLSPNDESVFVERRIISYEFLEPTDIAIGYLDEDVSNIISFAKVLPENYQIFVGDGEGLPSFEIDKNYNVVVFDVFSLYTGSVSEPTDDTRYNFYTPLAGGDSGTPMFLLWGSTPILLYAVQTTEGGPSIVQFRESINEIMAQLDVDAEQENRNVYQLTEQSLAASIAGIAAMTVQRLTL